MKFGDQKTGSVDSLTSALQKLFTYLFTFYFKGTKSVMSLESE